MSTTTLNPQVDEFCPLGTHYLLLSWMNKSSAYIYGDEIVALFSDKAKCRCTHLLAP
jgi:hypothetical protein